MTEINPHQHWLQQELAQIRPYAVAKETDFDLQARLLVDLHLDSLEMLELVSAVEKYMARPLEDKIWMQWYRLQDVLDHLNQYYSDGS